MMNVPVKYVKNSLLEEEKRELLSPLQGSTLKVRLVSGARQADNSQELHFTGLHPGGSPMEINSKN